MPLVAVVSFARRSGSFSFPLFVELGSIKRKRCLWGGLATVHEELSSIFSLETSYVCGSFAISARRASANLVLKKPSMRMQEASWKVFLSSSTASGVRKRGAMNCSRKSISVSLSESSS